MIYNPNQFNILSGGEKCALRGLLKNNDIVICRPDKGNGVVVMDKVEYSRKLDQILSDKTKFVELACDPTADLESKLNNFLYNLKRTGKIDESTFHRIRSVGACPGRIYGLPKTHKMGVPLRPIVSCVGTYSYNLAQYLVELLQPFSHNSFTVKDSFAFAKEVTTCSSFPFMASFDVTSLFTCVPLEEVINICLDKLFANTNTVNNLNRTQLYKMLSFALKQNHFLFDGKVYNQVDGVAMGSPLGPVMANIFMCELERKALEQYNGTLPSLYRRYVDDTFLVFNTSSDMVSFFEWMNKQHPSITFTKEEEQDNKLSFLDVLLTRTTDGSIVTSIYRKPTFSGLYMKWDSFVPKSYKKGLVNCLVFRAWKLCSSYVLFHSEILFAKELLMSNGYPANFIDSIVHRFLSKQFSNTDVMQPYGPHKRRVYLCLPYVGELATNKFARQIRRLIAKIAPCVELRLVFRAAQKLSCLRRLKSKLNVLSRSGVVYQISCSQCEAFYVGKTKRRLEQRVQEHSQQGYSSLYKHSSDLCHQIDYSNPAVISVDNNDYRLQIKEALKIKDLKAYNSLNANIRSCELKLW